WSRSRRHVAQRIPRAARELNSRRRRASTASGSLLQMRTKGDKLLRAFNWSFSGFAQGSCGESKTLFLLDVEIAIKYFTASPSYAQKNIVNANSRCCEKAPSYLT